MNLIRLTHTIDAALRNIYEAVEPEDAEEVVERITEAFPEIVFTPLSDASTRTGRCE